MKTERNLQSVNTYNIAAENYESKFMTLNLYNDTYDLFCNYIVDKKPTLLEIASGPGNVTKYLRNKRPDFNIIGIDLAPNMVALAKKNNPEVDFKVMDCNNISSINSYFNAIMCGFCMPYLSKEACEKLILDAATLLNPNGIFYISTMEGNYDKSGYEFTSFSGDHKVFIYYHQEAFLTECLVKYGFEILDLKRKKYPEPDGSFLTDMIFIAKKTS